MVLNQLRTVNSLVSELRRLLSNTTFIFNKFASFVYLQRKGCNMEFTVNHALDISALCFWIAFHFYALTPLSKPNFANKLIHFFWLIETKLLIGNISLQSFPEYVWIDRVWFS